MANYRETLNLPKTDFDMRANLAKKEPLQIEKWYAEDLYGQILKNNKDKPLYVLHDGPPYANGDIHVGTAFNKILKDIIIKYKSMSGYRAPYIPGWDCHGQPIEHEVEKKLGDKKAEMSQAVFRRLCREYALKFLDRQREQFKRLGVFGEWDHPYLTLDHEYEAANIEIFKAMYLRGVIYHGTKPIHWCRSCKTALAEAEIEYKDETSPAIYVKFTAVEGAAEALLNAGAIKTADEANGLDLKVLIWTTTPWTLPANVAVALNPDAEYSLLRKGNEILIVAKELIPQLQEDANLSGYEEAATVKGSGLDGLIFRHPIFEDKISRLVFADYVSLATGSGAVHIAPGHGQEDYLVGQKYKLPAPMPVDGEGRFTDEAGWLSGIDIYEGNTVIIKHLTDNGSLLARNDILHSYPHCWRCKSPVIFRATSQWFISMEQDDLRKEALKAVKEVSWVPDWSIRRIEAMVSDRPDWCISRQRSWGVPIPIFYCEKCVEVLGTAESFDAVIALFNVEGADSWFIKEASDILPAGTKCNCGGQDFRKESDILDVWFESGVSHAAVLKKRPDLRWPADLYLEGSDQHRGWFQSSLFCSVGAYHSAPFKTVLTHGFVVDGDGRKMSKSLGNVVDPLDVIANSGADILRLWVASQDYSVDVAISKDILDYISDAYRRIRNTIRFLHGNLAEYDWVADKVAPEDLLEIDKWALVKLNRLLKDATQSYEDNSYHQVFHKVYNFCITDMSSVYLDVLKDRLYTAPPGSLERTSGQTVIAEIIMSLTKLLAPILSFTTEEIWAILPENVKREKSVHLEQIPKADEALLASGIEERWSELLGVRGEVQKALEIARQEKLIGNSVEAAVHLYATDAVAGPLNEFTGDQLRSIFIVSQAEVSIGEGPEDAYHSQSISGLAVKVDKAAGEKCERCWNYRSSVGQHPEHATLCSRCIRAIESIVT